MLFAAEGLVKRCLPNAIHENYIYSTIKSKWVFIPFQAIHAFLLCAVSVSILQRVFSDLQWYRLGVLVRIVCIAPVDLGHLAVSRGQRVSNNDSVLRQDHATVPRHWDSCQYIVTCEKDRNEYYKEYNIIKISLYNQELTETSYEQTKKSSVQIKGNLQATIKTLLSTPQETGSQRGDAKTNISVTGMCSCIYLMWLQETQLLQ